MSNETRKRPPTPEELRRKAKDIINNNPIYIPDEPTTVGSPENLFDEDEDEHTKPTDEKN